jgi:hypothetical protein
LLASTLLVSSCTAPRPDCGEKRRCNTTRPEKPSRQRQAARSVSLPGHLSALAESSGR